MERPILKRSTLVLYVNQGLNRDEIAEKLNISRTELNHYFKEANIKLKAKKRTYELVMDEETPENKEIEKQADGITINA